MRVRLERSLAACVIAATMSGAAFGAECATGESEAVLVTKDGSITMCVQDDVVAARQSGATFALETVECPCAAVTPSARDWSRMKSEQSCEASGTGLVVSAMKAKGSRTEEKRLYTGQAGDVCSYQALFDGLVHRNMTYLLTTTAEAEACDAFARELYASFAGSKRQTASCQ